MINFKAINTKEMIVKEAINLGDFVNLYRNGKFLEMLDMKYGTGLNNLLSIQEENILNASKIENGVNVVLKNGEIIELIKTNKRYITKDSLISVIQSQVQKKRVRVMQNYTKGNISYTDKFYGDFRSALDLVIDKINNLYYMYSVTELPFTIEENRILFKEELYNDCWFNDEEHDMYCDVEDEQWCILELSFGEPSMLV